MFGDAMEFAPTEPDASRRNWRETRVRSLSQEERAVLEEVADWIVDHRLAAPAIVLFESLKPLGRAASVAMSAAHPLAEVFFATDRYLVVRNALEHRESIELLLEAIEAREIVTS